MFWHHTTRTTLLRRAILTSLIGAVGLHAHAVSLDPADVQSAQNQPLSATINVSDIDAKNFNASVANADIYQQMGLKPDNNISVQFTPTSDTTGQITITSNAPIDTPFADVVLNLNNNGEQVIEPQTLLMPMSAGDAFALPSGTDMITADVEQNLPTVSPTPTNTTPSGHDKDYINASSDPISPPSAGMSAGNNIYSPSESERVLSQIQPEGADKQGQILTEQVIRRIYPVGQAPMTHSQTEDDYAGEVALTPQRLPDDDGFSLDDGFDTQASSGTQSGQAAYTVQSGDTLWSIANTIAQANNMTVGEVMSAIHKANPSAFSHGNKNRLKANANLSLPNYQVIPSQKAIEEAIQARRHSKKEASSESHTKAASTRNTRKGTHTKAVSTRNTKAASKKALPKAQVTLVTPSQSGQATGTNNKSLPNATAGGGNLVTALKNTRQQTASTARRVNNLNQELSSATHKLQLQNQKLAELEARLKALKQKN